MKIDEQIDIFYYDKDSCIERSYAVSSWDEVRPEHQARVAMLRAGIGDDDRTEWKQLRIDGVGTIYFYMASGPTVILGDE